MRRVFEWSEPPPALQGGNRGVGWNKILLRVATKPGEWALIAREACSNILASLKKNHPEFEFITRSDFNGGVNVYARYVGEDS